MSYGVFSDTILNLRRGRDDNYACNCAYFRCCSSADTTATGLGGQDDHKRGIKRSRFYRHLLKKMHFCKYFPIGLPTRIFSVWFQYQYLTHTMVILGAKISTQLGSHCSNFAGPLVLSLGMIVWSLWIGSNSTGKGIYKSMCTMTCVWVFCMKFFNPYITYELLFCYH